MPGDKLRAMYVTRGSRPRGHRGWIAKIQGKPAKFFADAKHGGRLDAFRKARAYAERLADESRVNPATRRYVRKSPSRGVFRFVNRNRPGKPAMWIAVASLDKGKPQRRYFYVRKYGEKKAARLARQARAEMVSRILNGPRWLFRADGGGIATKPAALLRAGAHWTRAAERAPALFEE
jgi:hypothetical protein